MDIGHPVAIALTRAPNKLDGSAKVWKERPKLLVRISGVEPPRYFYHRLLRPARLPIPPYPHYQQFYHDVQKTNRIQCATAVNPPRSVRTRLFISGQDIRENRGCVLNFRRKNTERRARSSGAMTPPVGFPGEVRINRRAPRMRRANIGV